MQYSFCFEAVNCLLQDLRQSTALFCCTSIMLGVICQILSVVKRGGGQTL